MMTNSLFTEFVEACKEGDTNKFRKIISSVSIEDTNDLIAFNDYACFHLAAANGHSDIVEAIIAYVKSVTDKLPCEEALLPVFLARDGEGFKAALINQHIKMVELLLDQGFLSSYYIWIIENNLEFIKILWNSSLRNRILSIFSDACGQEISLVKNILKEIPPSSHHLLLEQMNGTGYINRPFTAACNNGKLEIMQFLWSLISTSYQNILIKSEFSSCYMIAVKNEHLDIIKQLLEWLPSDQKISLLISEDFSGFIYAADRGYIEILKFIWEHLPVSLQLEAVSASNFAAYRLATINQHYDVTDFLEENSTKETIENMKKAIHQGISHRQD